MAIELINKLPDIIKNGEIVENAGVNTIILKEGNSESRAGLSKGFFGKGDNQWVITSYEKKSPNAQNFDQVTNSKELRNGNNLSLKGKNNSTAKEIKSQELNLSRAERRAMGIEEPKGKTLVIDDKAVKSDVREFGRLADQVGLGFKSAKEHFEAVESVEELYKNAIYKSSSDDIKNGDKALKIHRYEADFKDNAKVLITLKESIDKNQNRIYTLEVDAVESKLSTKAPENKHSALNSDVKDFDSSVGSEASFITTADSANDKTIPNQDLKSADEFAELTFQDKKGKDHIITKEIQKEWIDTFGLKNLDDTYIPKFNNEIKKALGNKELKLQKGSLLKLVSQGRQKFIPEIKKVLDDPEIIITDKNGEIILAKHLNEKDYFVNVSFDNGEYLISISNGIKEINNLNNKIKQGGRILYQSPNANSISQTLLQTSQYSANKIDAETIPNQTIKEAENLTLLSRDIPSGDPKTGNLDNTAIIHTGEEPPRPRTSSPYNANTETIPNESIKEAETTKDLTADAPSELYKAHRKAQKAKETAKEPTTQAEPITQAKQEAQATKEADKKAKLDEEFAKNKAYVEGLEREAINKIEALHNLSKTKAQRIPLKSIISQAEQELKEFARLRAKETGASQERINNVKIKSLDDLKNHLDSLGLYLAKTKDKEGEALLNKYVEILNDISEARLNQRAIKKQNETQKDDLIKGVVDSLKGLQIVGLRNLSNFLVKYGKTDEFMTKANPKWKSEFDKARALMERDQNITPIKEFGTNYAEFYHDGANAIKKLLTERQGQVAGAFHKDGRDITISWGEAKMANGDIKGYGLSKIEAKHLDDFEIFKGDTPQEKLINGISEIIQKGEIKPRSGQNGVNIEYNGFIIGINKGFNGAGDNKWVVTAFDNSISKSEKKAKTARTDNFTSEVSNLSQNSKPNSTPKEIKSQAQVEQKAKQYAKWLSQADKIPPQAPDELYKAYNKAKRT